MSTEYGVLKVFEYGYGIRKNLNLLNSDTSGRMKHSMKPYGNYKFDWLTYTPVKIHLIYKTSRNPIITFCMEKSRILQKISCFSLYQSHRLSFVNWHSQTGKSSFYKSRLIDENEIQSSEHKSLTFLFIFLPLLMYLTVHNMRYDSMVLVASEHVCVNNSHFNRVLFSGKYKNEWIQKKTHDKRTNERTSELMRLPSNVTFLHCLFNASAIVCVVYVLITYTWYTYEKKCFFSFRE